MLGILLLLARVSILPMEFGQKFVADAERTLGTFLITIPLRLVFRISQLLYQ
jgi:hypothetical protein